MVPERTFQDLEKRQVSLKRQHTETGETMLNEEKQKPEENHPMFDADQTKKHNKQVSEMENENKARAEAANAADIREKVEGITVHGDQVFDEDQKKEFEKKRVKGDEYKNSINSILGNITKSSKDTKIVSLSNYIRLGDALYDAKAYLGMHFTAFITDELISAKQTQRYIKLIIKKKSEKTYSRLRKAGKEDFSKIEKDTRITELNEAKISTMIQPSMAKIMRMKELKDNEFNDVIGGDDTKYVELQKRDSKATREKNRNEIDAKKPDGMDEEVYKEFLKHGVHYVLEQYQILENKHEELKRDNADKDDTLKSFDNVLSRMAGAKLYTSSSHEKTEEQKILESVTH